MLREAILPQLSNRELIKSQIRYKVDQAGSLKTSLLELGLSIDTEPTWETCDQDCKALIGQLQKSNLSEFTQKPFSEETTTLLLGAVMTEAISAAFWSDVLLVYNHK